MLVAVLDTKACPGHVDFIPGHVNLNGFFQTGYELIFAAVYNIFIGIIQYQQVKISAGHVHL